MLLHRSRDHRGCNQECRSKHRSDGIQLLAFLEVNQFGVKSGVDLWHAPPVCAHNTDYVETVSFLISVIDKIGDGHEPNDETQNERNPRCDSLSVTGFVVR